MGTDTDLLPLLLLCVGALIALPFGYLTADLVTRGVARVRRR